MDRNLIGSSGKVGLEQYATTQGIGFGGGNTTLLEFAGQATVGESTRSAASYSEIVLGDPVARLPELTSNQNYDRTIGKRLNDSKGGSIESYSTLDYNKDGSEDIVVFYDDGRVELLQNFAGIYKSLGYLLYVVDAGPERKAAGDFNGDGYGDIVMVDSKGKLILIENRNGKFVRVPARVFDENRALTTIKGAIMQLEIFDMDHDGKMDLVMTDDSGELNILYGNSDANGIIFTKKVLDSNIGLKLQGGSLTTGGAVRWDGITEITPTTQTDYARETANAGTTGESSLSLADQKRLIDSKLYYLQSVKRQVASSTQAAEIRLRNTVGDDPNNPGSPNTALTSQIQSTITTTQGQAARNSFDTSALTNTTITEQRTYLRSEFADAKNITIAKVYTDKNGGTLQAGDRIDVAITITNTSSSTLAGVSYLDSNEKNVFKLSENTGYTIADNNGSVSQSGSLNSLVDGTFDYQFDNLSIPAGSNRVIHYEMLANSLAFGQFHVGIFETDDSYGDVTLNGNAICGEQEIEWKSTAIRSYNRIEKAIVAQGDASGKLDGKFTDFNSNSQPDYIDLLSGDGGPDELRSSQWDPARNGILVFREVTNNGVLDGTNFQIARLVGKENHFQFSPISQSGDTPILAPPGLTSLTRVAGKISSGDTGDLAGLECGKPGTITSDLILVGIEQSFNADAPNDLTGTLKIRARGTSKTLDTAGEVTASNACIISINEISNPQWDGQTVTGLGWKLLTKSSFNHYSLAGTQADLINSGRGIPDTEEPRGGDFLSYSASSGLR